MNKLKTQLKASCKQLWNDESGQGMMEYVLLAVGVLAMVVIFKSKIQGWFNQGAGAIDTQVGTITSGQ